MKKNYFFLLLLCGYFFVACNFSVGTKTDLNTGLSYNYNGFSIDNVKLVEETTDGEIKLESNKIGIRQKIAITLNGISGYTIKDGKAFPGLMMEVTDSKGAIIVQADDLFKEVDGMEPGLAAYLVASLTMGYPMESGQTYHMKVSAWDKMKTDNRITAEVDLVLQ